MSGQEPYRWSEPYGGAPAGLTPGDFYHLGRVDAALSVAQTRAVELANSDDPGVDLRGLNPTAGEVSDLADVLAETELEEAMIGDWSEGTSDIDQLEAEMRAYREEYRMDDLSRISDSIDLSNADDPAADLVDQNYGIGMSGRLRQRGAGRMVGALAREVGRQAARRGDILQMAEIYAETGISGTGHAIDLANAPGRDVSDAIELAQYVGDLAGPCGPRDALGGCAQPPPTVSSLRTQRAGGQPWHGTRSSRWLTRTGAPGLPARATPPRLAITSRA